MRLNSFFETQHEKNRSEASKKVERFSRLMNQNSKNKEYRDQERLKCQKYLPYVKKVIDQGIGGSEPVAAQKKLP